MPPFHKLGIYTSDGSGRAEADSRCISWLHANPKTIMDWQMEVVAIPAPPFGEQARAEWLACRFAEAGLSEVNTDAVGTYLASCPLRSCRQKAPDRLCCSQRISIPCFRQTRRYPHHRAVLEGERLQAPGACDNGAGVAGMLAIIHALLIAKWNCRRRSPCWEMWMKKAKATCAACATSTSTARLAGRVAAHIVLDGAGTDTAVTRALGSLRFEVIVTGPGGHSFTDAGTPNPIAALATALARLAESPLPEEPRTTMNLGTIRGGISVNSIPERAQATVDFRSTDRDQLARLEAELQSAVEDAVKRLQCKSAGCRDRGLARARCRSPSPRLVTAPPRIWQTTLRCWLLCAR